MTYDEALTELCALLGVPRYRLEPALRAFVTETIQQYDADLWQGIEENLAQRADPVPVPAPRPVEIPPSVPRATPCGDTP